jgi:hypothetical protein
VGLAFAIAARGHAACADPSAPQVNSGHLQREDARLLEDQQRGVDGEEPPAADAPAAAPILEAPAASMSSRGHTMRVAGVVLLSVSAVSALISVPVFEARSADAGTMRGTDDTTATVLVVTAVVAGITGAGLLWAGWPTVQVAPTATPKSVGLAIMGRL